ncbi:MFS transporter [Zhongshania sp.]|uniref:MFS transporter n=1 Tax=Zhongshania sp. TaxID=1971902 RepID=UPI00356530E7
MYYGWYVVMMAAAVYAVVMGTTFSAFGLFVVPVSEDLNLSRADMNTALILLNIGSALLAPVVGRMLDRISARLIMIASALLAGLSFTLLSFSTSLLLSGGVMALMLAAAVQGGCTLTMSMLLARWFTARRGRAMILAMMGASLGSIFIVPLIGWLIEHEGWRATLLIIGVFDMVFLLALALVVRERPRPGELETAAVSDDAEASKDLEGQSPASIKFLLSMPQFWTLGISCAIAMAMMQTIIITIVPLAVAAGLTTVQAAGLISITGVAALASKILLAVVADRFDRILMLAVLFALGTIVSILLVVGDTYLLLVACALMLGISSSAAAPIFYALLADRFGMSSFGTVRGLMSLLIAVASAVAIRLAGEAFDLMGNYDYVFYTFIGLGGLAVVLILSTWLTRTLVADDSRPVSSSV